MSRSISQVIVFVVVCVLGFGGAAMGAPTVHPVTIQVDAYGGITLPPSHPLAGEAGGPAEVFTETRGRLPPNLAIHLRDQPRLFLDLLNGVFVKHVAIFATGDRTVAAGCVFLRAGHGALIPS